MMNFHSLRALLLAGTVFAGGAACAQEIADTIYRGGPILTINDAQPTAEAVAVKDGRILAVGALADIEAHKGDETTVFELDGRAMVPGFVDSHGHVVFGGLQALSANLLPPPDGGVADIASLQESLRKWIEDNAETVDKVQMVIGFGYDNAQLAELRHPTREELDAVSTELPILIVHQSGHLGVVNSKALELAGVTADTKDPSGGVIRRDENGEPNGVLEEYAFFTALGKMLGDLGEEGMHAFARAGAELWARFGYTTAQDGRSAPSIVEVLKKLGAEGDLPIDVVAFPDVLEAPDYIVENFSQDYTNGVRVGGCKLTIDGSPQGFTALRDRPYYNPVGDYPPGYSGYAVIGMDVVQNAVNHCYKNGLQIITHSNGEAASDMLLTAIEVAQKEYSDANNRPVLVHGQFLREDQVDTIKRLDVFPSLFPMHTFYWGDWHRDHTVGPVAADNISPTGWVRQRDMMFGSHHDAPVALPDSMRILSATVTRRTRSGDILGPSQRVDVPTALKAMTIWPAWQHFEEDDKGSIETGKLADFVILSDDPTAIDPETLSSLTVQATIKNDRVVYEADGSMQKTEFLNWPVGPDGEASHHLLHAMYDGMSKK
ncbi:amidohydrolase family protein [Nitratireductor aquimarinus]|uniref:Amidohydrolase family protein n=4 Tax=Phyllobacteriaceae TaxID=69277 RepID=A0ABU4AF01_9HYPH|nr:amidohydrolase family protein [Nitratireductor aquimarinus]MDV6224804.1 amidohydrolase family protein [Nitratireductor aquimarinus]